MEKGYALVTGASQGIGRAIALELASRGFGIVAAARSRDKLEECARACAALNGGRAQVIETDLSRPDGVDRLIGGLDEARVPLRVLVNNAGYAVWGRFADKPLEEHLRMLQVNVTAPLELTHRLLPRLREHPPSYILNVGSSSGYTAVATLSTYSGGKALLLKWSRALRLELEGSGVRVCCVCPGSVITGFTGRAGMGALDHLVRRFGRPPEAIARTAVKAMLAGRAEVVPGLLDRITAQAMKLLPDALTERIASGIYVKHLPERSGEAGGTSAS